MGDDTNTNCCIVDSIALIVIYGIIEEQKIIVEMNLPSNYVKILKNAYK